MINLSRRSSELEMMESSGYSFADLKSCLGDIAKINRWTCAHRGTLLFVEKMYLEHRGRSNLPMKIMDVGFGSGDLLREIAKFGQKKGYEFDLIGVELNPWSCKIAADLNVENFSIRFLHLDFKDCDEMVDVIVSSLLTHHLTDGEFCKFVSFMSAKARHGWLIHDLHRHSVPYYFIKYLTRMTGLHKMVQNDAPLSVARGFLKNEVELLLKKSRHADIETRVRWEFPFKICIYGFRKGLK